MTSHLTWQHFPMDESGFFHTPVLVCGATDAVLIDGGPMGMESVAFTRAYMLEFEEERAAAPNAATLIAAMNRRYPDFPGAMWLELRREGRQGRDPVGTAGVTTRHHPLSLTAIL